MVTINDEALDELTQVIESLLGPTDPGIERDLLISPIKIKPTGIGGFIGINEDPRGEIVGRRIEADVRFVVSAPNGDSLSEALNDVSRALLTSDRVALRQSGILRVDLDTVAPVLSQGGRREREISYRVLFEYLRRPEEDEFEIERIPIVTAVNPVNLLDISFGDGSFDMFEVIDDPGANRSGPSNWSYDPVEMRIQQLSNIYGGSNQVNANKPGTYLLLSNAEGVQPLSDMVFSATLSADDDDGIGLVFRFQDVNNFYFFYADSQRGYRLLGKKTAGQFEHMSEEAVDETGGYETGVRFDVTVEAVGPFVRVLLDNRQVLQSEDASIAGPGRVGFMARQNNAAFFYGLSLTEVQRG